MENWKVEHEDEYASDQTGANSKRLCAECRKPLDLGVDVLTLEPGVIGPRGVVPLGDAQLFCSEACLRGHLGTGEPPATLKRRVP